MDSAPPPQSIVRIPSHTLDGTPRAKQVEGLRPSLAPTLPLLLIPYYFLLITYYLVSFRMIVEDIDQLLAV